MPARIRGLSDLIPVVFALALVLPGGAAAQAQPGDTTHKGTPKDLPLTAAQRQAFVGSYAVTLPYGEPRSFRIFEENGMLKAQTDEDPGSRRLDRKSTRLNSSHLVISYAVFCLKQTKQYS